ncbi:MAG: protein-disulfide reductase DsbD N-terminal domain-containing protein [Vicinamibacterales bacterium]
MLRTTHTARTLLTSAIVFASAAWLAVPLPADQATNAQSTPVLSTDPTRADTRHLTLTTSASTRNVRPGARVSLFVDVTPKPKMHVYSPEQKDVIPVALKLDPPAGVQVGAANYPKPEQYFFAPLNETQLVYSKPFRLTQEIVVNASSPSVTIKGTLRYQACDEAICYLPQTVPVSWTLTVNK